MMSKSLNNYAYFLSLEKLDFGKGKKNG